jgi:nucleoside-diphosphate-sugar epimerase
MHVLIIGGTRFVGYQLTWRLLAAGHQVTLLNRGKTPDPFGQRVQRLQADRRTDEFDAALAGRRFDAVVDFAGYTGADAQRSVRVLDQGRMGHYIFISTGQVYLVRENCPWPARELDYAGPTISAPADPADHEEWVYGMEKRAAEDVLHAAFRTQGFPVTTLRLPMVNGERDHFRRIESYLWRILDGGPVLLPDGGTHACQHVYSGEVVNAIMAVLGNPATIGQTYNLSQDEAPTLAELVTMLADLLGAPARTVAVPARDLTAAGLKLLEVSPFSDPWMSRLDASRARAELGFRHQPLARYLDKIVSCFLNHPPASPPVGYRHRARELTLA